MQKIYGIGKLNQILVTCFATEIVFAFSLPVQSAKAFCAFCQYFKIICALRNPTAFSLNAVGIKVVLLLCPFRAQRLSPI